MGGLSMKMKIENWKGHEIRFVYVDGEWWAVAKDVARALGYTVTANMTGILEPTFKRYLKIDTAGGPQTVCCINIDGIKLILIKVRRSAAIDFADVLGLDVIPMKKEQEYIRIIKAAFKHLEVYEQYPVRNYKVDLYIPSLNLVVECDEYGHEHYDIEKEIQRQLFIEKELKARFIRFNPDASDFNIGDVINEILLLDQKEKDPVKIVAGKTVVDIEDWDGGVVDYIDLFGEIMTHNEFMEYCEDEIKEYEEMTIQTNPQ